jgi:uncharacterized ion transporter superfamily protein YfcC
MHGTGLLVSIYVLRMWRVEWKRAWDYQKPMILFWACFNIFILFFNAFVLYRLAGKIL